MPPSPQPSLTSSQEQKTNAPTLNNIVVYIVPIELKPKPITLR